MFSWPLALWNLHSSFHDQPPIKLYNNLCYDYSLLNKFQFVPIESRFTTTILYKMKCDVFWISTHVNLTLIYCSYTPRKMNPNTHKTQCGLRT